MLSTACAIVVVIAISRPLHANQNDELPASRLGVRTAPLLLLTRADIRDDLQLAPEQTDEALRAIEQLHGQAAGLRGRNDEAAVAARRAIDFAQQNWIDTQLTPEQRARLAQLELQWEGPSAVVTRPQIAEALALDPGQRAQLAVALRQHRARNDRSDSAFARKVLGILSAEQAERWKALLGKPLAIRTSSASPESPSSKP
jgi:hypothetical protein